MNSYLGKKIQCSFTMFSMPDIVHKVLAYSQVRVEMLGLKELHRAKVG